MNGYERRMNIIEYLQNSDKAVSGKDLASLYHVSRQVIVQDIALLRAKDYDIVSTNHGYILNERYNYWLHLSCIGMNNYLTFKFSMQNIIYNFMYKSPLLRQNYSRRGIYE